MDKIMKKIFLLLFIVPFIYNYSQSFTVSVPDLNQTINTDSEAAYIFSISNISNSPLNIYIKKEIVQIPTDWSASLCFEYCFSPLLDSVNTTQFNGTPLAIGETREVSVHVFTSSIPGTASINFTVGNLSVASDNRTLNITTTVNPVSVDEENTIIKNFVLNQNYPNPFNPATTISYSLPQASYVSLDIYDILGNKVETLVNKEQASGNYTINFNAKGLSSGIYFYTLKANNNSITKKMVLSK